MLAAAELLTYPSRHVPLEQVGLFWLRQTVLCLQLSALLGNLLLSLTATAQKDTPERTQERQNQLDVTATKSNCRRPHHGLLRRLHNNGGRIPLRAHSPAAPTLFLLLALGSNVWCSPKKIIPKLPCDTFPVAETKREQVQQSDESQKLTQDFQNALLSAPRPQTGFQVIASLGRSNSFCHTSGRDFMPCAGQHKSLQRSQKSSTPAANLSMH